MTGELPPEAANSLHGLLDEAETLARDGERDAVLALLDDVRQVVGNLPSGETSERLRHGCVAVERTAGDEPLVAGEYIRSMRDVVDGATE